MSEPRKIKKKACPYCGKKLQAANELKWRNNLSRHLSKTCALYQTAVIRTMNSAFYELCGRFGLGDFAPADFPVPYIAQPPFCFQPQLMPKDKARHRAEIEELERLYASSAPESTNPPPKREPNKT